MNSEEAREKRESILTELTAKWHARDCGCETPEQCIVADNARRKAEELVGIAADGLRKRGWF